MFLEHWLCLWLVGHVTYSNTSGKFWVKYEVQAFSEPLTCRGHREFPGGLESSAAPPCLFDQNTFLHLRRKLCRDQFGNSLCQVLLRSPVCSLPGALGSRGECSLTKGSTSISLPCQALGSCGHLMQFWPVEFEGRPARGFSRQMDFKFVCFWYH